MLLRGRLPSENRRPESGKREGRPWLVIHDPSKTMLQNSAFRMLDLQAGGFDQGTIFVHETTGQARIADGEGSVKRIRKKISQNAFCKKESRFIMEFTNIITGEPIVPLPWQLELKPGDLYIIENPSISLMGSGTINLEDIAVYGEILDAKNCAKAFFNVRAFSRYCPKGEEGLLCIVEPTRRITRGEFDAAREKDWK